MFPPGMYGATSWYVRMWCIYSAYARYTERVQIYARTLLQAAFACT